MCGQFVDCLDKAYYTTVVSISELDVPNTVFTLKTHWRASRHVLERLVSGVYPVHLLLVIIAELLLANFLS